MNDDRGLASPRRRQPSRRFEITTGSAEPWWTEADDAELDLLAYELVRGYFEHKPRCASCAAGDPPCPHLRRAIEAVTEWREARELRSRAEYLRAGLDRVEGAA
jgi:hypothetical protein